MKLAAAAVGTALALSASHAEAASLFDLFRVLCIEPEGNAQLSIERASAMGWRKASAEYERLATRPSRKEEVVTNVDSRALKDLRGTVGVYVATTNRMSPEAPLPARGCVIMAGPDLDRKSVAAEALEYAAVQPIPRLAYQKSATVYLWRETEGRHVPVTVEEAGSSGAGAVRMMVVMARSGVVVLQYFVPASEQS